jgi:hypothetical protein
LSGCTKGDSLCSQACKNYAARCGPLSRSSSSLGSTDCEQSCGSGLASKSRSSGVVYMDMLFCVANAKSCAEIQGACSP